MNFYNKTFKFGDFILIQNYKQKHKDGKYVYVVEKPELGIFLNYFPADQTIGFDYIKWIKDSIPFEIDFSARDFMSSHYDWDDHLELLGSWKYRPNWEEILESYRKANLNFGLEVDFQESWKIEDEERSKELKIKYR